MRLTLPLLLFCLNVLAQKPPKALFIKGGQVSDIHIQASDKLQFDPKIISKREKKSMITLQIDEKIKKGLVQIQAPQGGRLFLVLKEGGRIRIENFQNTKWNISLKKAAPLEIKKSTGAFSISLDEGALSMSQGEGRISAELYSASLLISDWKKAKGQVLVYSSPIAIEKAEGRFELKSYSGPLHLDRLTGSLQFRVEKAPTRLKLFKGDIEGFSGSGEVRGSIEPGQVRIETHSAAIRVFFTEKNRPRVEAKSEENKVYAPRNFYTDRSGGVYRAKGRIKGAGSPKGQVFLKSRSGRIYIQ